MRRWQSPKWVCTHFCVGHHHDDVQLSMKMVRWGSLTHGLSQRLSGHSLHLPCWKEKKSVWLGEHDSVPETMYHSISIIQNAFSEMTMLPYCIARGNEFKTSRFRKEGARFNRRHANCALFLKTESMKKNVFLPLLPESCSEGVFSARKKRILPKGLDAS